MERTTHLALRSSTFFFLTSLKSILYSNKLCQQVEEARQNAAGWARQHRKSMTPTNWQPLERPIDYVVAHDRIPTFRPTRRFLLFWGGTKSNEWKKTRKSSAAGGKSWTSNCVHTVRTSVILTPERSFFRRLNRNEKKKNRAPKSTLFTGRTNRDIHHTAAFKILFCALNGAEEDEIQLGRFLVDPVDSPPSPGARQKKIERIADPPPVSCASVSEWKKLSTPFHVVVSNKSSRQAIEPSFIPFYPTRQSATVVAFP